MKKHSRFLLSSFFIARKARNTAHRSDLFPVLNRRNSSYEK